MTAVPPRPAAPEVHCTCGGDVWRTCDQCGADAWCSHHCGFPCDDVTCENGTVCTGCLTGRLCPVHNDDEWEDEVMAAPDASPVETLQERIADVLTGWQIGYGFYALNVDSGTAREMAIAILSEMRQGTS